MAHLLYRKNPACVVNIFEGDIEISPSDDNHLLFEYDFNPETDYLGSLRLSEDGTSLVNVYSGKSIQEQIDLCVQEQRDADILSNKEEKIKLIKFSARKKIEDLDWKVERAKERDLLNGNNDAMIEVSQEREQIRQASNAHEETLLSLTTWEEVESFDPNDF